MQKVIEILERWVFAPFLFSVQPVLQLYLINITEMDFAGAVRALLIALFVGVSAYGLFYVFVRDVLRASLITSVFVLFFFFFFAEIGNWLSTIFELGPARRDLIVLSFTGLCMLIWIGLVRTGIKDISAVNMYFNLLSILFLVNSGIQMKIRLDENGVSLRQSNRPVPVAVDTSGEQRPDIYYIILDGYGRDDILDALYEFDNSSFVVSLEDRGFYVADQASSNYVQTLLSISSSFNMDYLQNLQVEGRELRNRGDLIEILNYSNFRSVLAGNGYQTISFGNEYKATLTTADLYFDDSALGIANRITAFESIVFDNSMARIFANIPSVNAAMVMSPYDTHTTYILSTFGKLKDISLLDGDYFIYAHIIAPHPPFVFNENGETLMHDEPFTLLDANYYIKNHSRRAYISGYRKQIQYINLLVLETVDAILENSKTPPVILIQGDHGPGAYFHWGSLEKAEPAERFGILSAYYFPNQDYESLYSSISPVNSFRAVSNQYLGGNYELLEDRYYYSQWSFPFKYVEVTDLSLP